MNRYIEKRDDSEVTGVLISTIDIGIWEDDSLSDYIFNSAFDSSNKPFMALFGSNSNTNTYGIIDVLDDIGRVGFRPVSITRFSPELESSGGGKIVIEGWMDYKSVKKFTAKVENYSIDKNRFYFIVELYGKEIAVREFTDNLVDKLDII